MERESRESLGEIHGYTGMYLTTAMHTDSCTQHMNTYFEEVSDMIAVDVKATMEQIDS